MKHLVFLSFGLVLCGAFAKEPVRFGPRQLAVYRAHTILPESLRHLVRKNGKHLMEGLARGLAVDGARINARLIVFETDRITQMVNGQRPFREVVDQMGYVSGLFAVYSDPSAEAKSLTKKGFNFFLDKKMKQFHFVFDGYQNDPIGLGVFLKELAKVPAVVGSHRALLDDRYARVEGNYRYNFSERSAVFGICSIYFSNLARFSARLWYYAWSNAHGDLTRTPFVGQGQRTKRSGP